MSFAANAVAASNGPSPLFNCTRSASRFNFAFQAVDDLGEMRNSHCHSPFLQPIAMYGECAWHAVPVQ
jgi:hypothetical protein